jgi:hypothetical protein
MKLVLAALAATLTCAAAASAAFGAAPPGVGATAGPGSPPVEVPVPAEVIAAHPDGRVLHPVRVEAVDPATARATMIRDGVLAPDAQPIARRLAVASRSLASGCWRAYYEYTDNSWLLGKAETHIHPLWCGNGYWLTAIDNSWRWQTCTNLIACLGTAGPFLGAGCTTCDQAWYTFKGYFSGLAYVAFHFIENIAYAVYGNGQSWSYGWEEH